MLLLIIKNPCFSLIVLPTLQADNFVAMTMRAVTGVGGASSVQAKNGVAGTGIVTLNARLTMIVMTLARDVTLLVLPVKLTRTRVIYLNVKINAVMLVFDSEQALVWGCE